MKKGRPALIAQMLLVFQKTVVNIVGGFDALSTLSRSDDHQSYGRVIQFGYRDGMALSPVR